MNAHIFRNARRAWTLVLPLSLLGALSTASSGCSILLGNVKPVEEKSDDYGVMDLSRENPDWLRLSTSAEVEASSPDQETKKTSISDVAYQSQRTASIISLNSACRPITAAADPDLKGVTRQLLLGFTELREKEEKEISLRGTPALQTTVLGKANGTPMKIRTVVLQQEECVYDLLYLARPSFFDEQEPDFARFVSSLRLK